MAHSTKCSLQSRIYLLWSSLWDEICFLSDEEGLAPTRTELWRRYRYSPWLETLGSILNLFSRAKFCLVGGSVIRASSA